MIFRQRKIKLKKQDGNQKNASITSCLLNIFGETIGGTVPETPSMGPNKGQHFVLFPKHFR